SKTPSYTKSVSWQHHRGNAAELFSGIRHIAINILTNDKVFKAGLRRKMRKAAMDRNYLASVLTGSGLS
ncbi:transposase, partial [Escherichia coli]|nr:transposase [Escherichia coli]